MPFADGCSALIARRGRMLGSSRTTWSRVVQVWRAHVTTARAGRRRSSCSAPRSTTAGRSPVFRARLDHAADLYRDRHRADDRRHRRQAARRPVHRSRRGRRLPARARASPTPRSCARRRAVSSWESLAASARFLQAPRHHASVVLVSDPFHSLRIRLIADELGFDAVTSPTRTSPIRGFDGVAALLRRGAARRGRTDLRLRPARLGASARPGGERRASGVAILAAPSGVV